MAETLNLQIPSPTFEGSTGGWLRAAEVEEKYAITWTSPKEQVFEIISQFIYYNFTKVCLAQKILNFKFTHRYFNIYIQWALSLAKIYIIN